MEQLVSKTGFSNEQSTRVICIRKSGLEGTKFTTRAAHRGVNVYTREIDYQFRLWSGGRQRGNEGNSILSRLVLRRGITRFHTIRFSRNRSFTISITTTVPYCGTTGNSTSLHCPSFANYYYFSTNGSVYYNCELNTLSYTSS